VLASLYEPGLAMLADVHHDPVVMTFQVTISDRWS